MPLSGKRRRDYDRKRARQQAAKDRDIEIPRCADRRRRRRLEKSPERWLRWYFPDRYKYDFTAAQRDMLNEIIHRATHGGDQAIADYRGGGKTTITEGAVMFAINTGLRRFPVVAAATGHDAERILLNIKREYETNERLHDDYPEICAPIWALEGGPQRGAMQTVNGKRTFLKWGQDYVQFARVEGSPAAGSIIATRGLDGAIRGLKYGNLRPDLLIIDDADSRESANSETQTKGREEVIDRDLAGLAPPDVRLARILLCTIINRRCLAFTFTDRRDKPSWNGRRHRLMIRKPDREDLWDEYISLRQKGMRRDENPDRDGREAHAFYLAHRAEMDAGAIVSNPNRYSRTLLDDGTEAEASTLQSCYNIIADRGLDAFLTEFQNDPPEEETPEQSGITANLVQERLNGYEKWLVPDEADLVTTAIDLGKRRLHYVQIAWKKGATGWVVDYGIEETSLTAPADAKDEKARLAEEKAIYMALMSWRDHMLASPLHKESGEEVRPSLILIDDGNGDWSAAVAEFLRQVGGRPFAAAKGFGSGYGQSPFRAPPKVGLDKWVGDHWYVKRQASGVYMHALHSDYWKRFVHDRFMTPVQSDGALTLWGEEKRLHLSYSKHITSEVWREPMVVNGKLRKAYWHVHNRNNHWFDATYMACAAAAMCGVTLLPRSAAMADSVAPPHQKRPPQPAMAGVGAGAEPKPSAWTPQGWKL